MLLWTLAGLAVGWAIFEDNLRGIAITVAVFCVVWLLGQWEEQTKFRLVGNKTTRRILRNAASHSLGLLILALLCATTIVVAVREPDQENILAAILGNVLFGPMFLALLLGGGGGGGGGSSEQEDLQDDSDDGGGE
jgi:hypothetical protein